MSAPNTTRELVLSPRFHIFSHFLPRQTLDRMYGRRSEEIPSCCFHPQEKLVGVCALCLNEKLIFLASKQGYFSSGRTRSFSLRSTPTSTSFSKIFAFTSFLHRLEFRHSKPEYSDLDASPSHDDSADSFISMKFEENGVASWEKNKNPKVALQECKMTWNQSLSKADYGCEGNEINKSVTEVVKSRAPLRWRKRIGHLFQLMRSKRSSKANMCHVGNKPDRVKLRKGWIRSQRKSRTRSN